MILFDCSVVPVPGLPDDAVPVPAPMDDDMDSDDDLDARIYGKKADRIGNKTAEEEVATYLKEDPADPKQSTLAWWHLKRSTYPRLNRLAMDYLAIQGSSTASEREFSKSGRVLGKDRAMMSAKTLEALMLTKAWNQYSKLYVTPA